MPGFNGSGPMGSGSMSGKGQGRCSGSMRGQGMFAGARGLGQRRGVGMFSGRRGFSSNVLNKEQEAIALKESVEILKSQLENMQKQISELEH